MAEDLPNLRRSGINVLSMWGQQIAGTLVILVIMPIITNHFGLGVVGVWLLVSQYAQHLMLLEMGLNTSLSRFLSRYRASGDLTEASRYLSASMYCLLAMGGLVVLVSPLLAGAFAKVFELPPAVEPQIYWLVLLASLAVGLTLPLRTGIGMLSSRHRFDRLALWETLVPVVRLILVLVCFHWFDPNLIVLGLITFIPIVIGNVMIFRDGMKFNRDLTIEWGLLSRHVMLGMFSISGATIVITMSAVVVRQSSPMLVGYSFGTEPVALLAFPILIVSAVMPFLGVASRMISPVASHLDAQEMKGRLYDVSIMASRYVFSLSLLALVGFFYLGYPMLDLWLGGPKVEDSALLQMSEILVVIFAGFAVATPGFILRSVLVVGGLHWQAARAEMVGSLLGIGLGLLLMLGTSLNVMGMAIGVAVAFAIRGIGFLSIRGAQYFSVSYLRLLRDSMLRPIAIAAVAAIGSGALAGWIPQQSNQWLAGVIPYAFFVAVWFVGVWFFIADSEHKRKIGAGLRLRLIGNDGTKT